MPTERHPSDRLVEELTGMFELSVKRLQSLVDAGLRRGLSPGRAHTADQRAGDATLAYRNRQLQQGYVILDQLKAHTRTTAPLVTTIAYRAGMLATDKFVDNGLAGELAGGPNVRAAEIIAQNLTSRLHDAIETTRGSLQEVFARATQIDGKVQLELLKPVGRLTADELRSTSLQEVGRAVLAGDARRELSEQLAKRLVQEGVVDATTGYVDRAGRRWPLDAYTRMVARTTTREAVSQGTATRLLEAGQDLVAVDSHTHKADECTPYDGKTFSLSGTSTRYPPLDRMPPFHPNCRHVLAPATADLDAWEAELQHHMKAERLPEPPATGSPSARQAAEAKRKENRR